MSPSDLCAACGMCCSGVMFHRVHLQPGDSAQALKALGLHIKLKKGAQFFPQPCSAFRDCSCAIYQARPQRCRLFECKQLTAVASGQISADAALENIRGALAQLARLEELFARSGPSDPKKPLSKRYEQLTAEPPDPGAGAQALALRAELDSAMADFEALLAAGFRVE